MLGSNPFRILRDRMLLAICALMLASLPCHAAGLSLGWQDSRALVGPGLPDESASCTSPIGVGIPLYPAFVLTAPIDSVIAMEFVLDVVVAAPELPAWWRIGTDPCRPTGWSIDATPAVSASDPWAARGAVGTLIWTLGQPFSDPSHGRLTGAMVVTPGALVSLAADTPYTIGRLLLSTTGSGPCPGCSLPACLVLNSLLIRRLPGSVGEEIRLASPETPGAERVTWQGGQGADCSAVPTRRSSWGQVKASYR